MMIDDDVLKYDGQWPKLIYALAMLMKFLRYEVSLMIILRCFQDNLLGPGSNKLLHLAIKLLSSSFKKGIHFIIGLFGINPD